MTDYAQRRTMMVDTQVRPSDVTKFPIIEAMLAIPREEFVPNSARETAYLGDNVPLGPRRVLLEPRSLAKMLDAVNIQPTEMVLDIGAGQGYSSAVIGWLAQMVIAVEEDADLYREAESALAELGYDNIALTEGPLTEGAAQHGPYDVIMIEGAVEQVPDALLDQLKEGGRIAAIFMEGALGVCRIGYKIDGRVSWRFAFNASAPVLPGFEKENAFVF